MKGDAKPRLLMDENGFSLTEVLVTMLIMIIVLFALYSLFDMTMRVYSVGNDKVEAVENARLGLEKMKREIQAAYPFDVTDDSTVSANTSAIANDYLFWNPASPSAAAMPSTTSITFGNDLNGNYRVDTATEQITYSLSGTTLRRTVGTGTPQPVVEFVQEVDTSDGDTTPLTFTYLNANGTTTTDQAAIRTVRIKLEVSVDRGIEEQPVTQILTTDVALRNRGEK